MSVKALIVLGSAVFLAGISLFSALHHTVVITPTDMRNRQTGNLSASVIVPTSASSTHEQTSPPGTLSTAAPMPPVGMDLPNQPHLENPPQIMRGIYLTGWSAGSKTKIESIVSLVHRTELNAVVIDIKDYSGTLSYAAQIPLAASSGALKEIKISHPNALVKVLHDNGIYVIGRITVFQDPVLARAHPEWALKNKTTGGLWYDNHGLAWMDPASIPVWDYIVAIAQDASARGFDEIQFDYVRFASDGALGTIAYPSWDGKTSRATIIANFFKYLRAHLLNTVLSVDLFGLSTVNHDDLGIGQVIENAYKYFDYVSPMVYPSHFATGFLGYKNPAKYPYEVIRYSMEHALARLSGQVMVPVAANNSSTSLSDSSTLPIAPPPNYRAKLRPWLQDFNLGATYDASMVRKQIQAAEEVLATSSTRDTYDGGWFLWNAANNYTEGALAP